MKVFDTVEREMEADSGRFGCRISDDELAKKCKKKYVFCQISNSFLPSKVWS